MLRKISETKGFSLVEIIISILIIGVIVLAFLPFFTGNMRATRQASERTETLYELSTVVERHLGSRPSLGSDTIPIVYGGETYSVRGNQIEENDNGLNITLKSWVTSFGEDDD